MIAFALRWPIDSGLNAVGLTILSGSVTGILSLVVWCYYRLLAAGAGKDDESPHGHA